MRNDIQWWLENWDAAHGSPEVRLYVFGNGALSAPVMKGDTYLTSAICYLYVKGEGKPNLEAPATGEITYLGGGYFFYGIEIKLGTTREQLFDKLDTAKTLLLAGVKDHAQT